LALRAHVSEGDLDGELLARVNPLAWGPRLRLVVSAARVFGLVRTPASLLAHRLLRALLDGGRPTVEVRGLGDLAIDPLGESLWQLVPRSGWRLPDQRGLALADVTVVPTGVIVGYAPRDQVDLAGDPAAMTLDGALARCQPGDALILADRPGDALAAYRAAL